MAMIAIAIWGLAAALFYHGFVNLTSKGRIMAELDDLKASVAKLETDLATNTSVLNKVRADLATALANAGPTGVDPAAVEAIAKQITTDATGLETEDAGPPAPAPTPTPPATPPSA